MDTNQNTYPFKVEGVRPSIGVVKAVAFVVGRDPMDLGPLAAILDPDALDDLILESDDVTVRFTMSGVDVRINSAGEILITDPDPASFIRTNTGEISNVLLMAVSCEYKACLDLLTIPDSDPHLLLVSYSNSPGNDPIAWQGKLEESYSSATMIQVGGFTRSTSRSTIISDVPLSPNSIVIFPDSQNLPELEIAITDWLTQKEGSESQQVVCFDSITELLADVDRDRATEFLHEVTRKMKRSKATAHFHLDPDQFDQETISGFAGLFDLSVYRGENERWEITEEFGC